MMAGKIIGKHLVKSRATIKHLVKIKSNGMRGSTAGWSNDRDSTRERESDGIWGNERTERTERMDFVVTLFGCTFLCYALASAHSENASDLVKI